MANFDLSLRLNLQNAQTFQAGLAQAVAGLQNIKNAIGRGLGNISLGNFGANVAQQTTQATGSINTMGTAVMGLKTKLLGLAAALGAGLAFKQFLQAGIELNQITETSRLGIAALIASQSELTDTQGRLLEGTEELGAASALASGEMQKLRIAGLQTSASYGQLTEAFQVAIGTGLSQGFTLDEIRKQVIQITQAAGALNLPYQQLNQEVRDLLQGTIDQNSQVALAIGMTTKLASELKASGNYLKELNRLMKPFTAAGAELQLTFAGARANLGEAIQILAAATTSGMFNKLREGFIEASKGLFDFDTATIAPRLMPLVTAFNNVFTRIGDSVKTVIIFIRDIALAIGDWISENRPQLDGIGAAFDRVGEQVGAIIGPIAGLTVAFVKFLFESRLIEAALGAIGLMFAGLRDGISLVGAGLEFMGGVFLLVLSGIMKNWGSVVGLFSDDIGNSIKKAAKNMQELGGVAVDGALATMDSFAKGETAVAKYVKTIETAKTVTGEVLSPETFVALSAGLADIAKTGQLSADSLKTLGITAVEGASSLKQLEVAARAAFESGKITAHQYTDILDQMQNKLTVAQDRQSSLNAALRLLNITPIGEASLEVTKLATNFEKLTANIIKTKGQVEAGGLKLIDSVKTKADFDVVEKSLGGLIVAGKEVNVEVKAQFEDLRRKMTSIGPGVETAFGQSLERMGVKTKTQLTAISEQFRVDFDRISKALNFQEQEVAFNKLAQASADANNGMVADFIRSEAAARGFKLTVKDLSVDFTTVTAHATTFSEQIRESFGQAVSSAGTVAQLEALRTKLFEVSNSGKLLGTDLTTALDLVSAKLLEVSAEPVTALSNAFKRLGISSKAQLTATATQFKLDFEAIAVSGEATSQQLVAGFMKYANAAIAANNGVIPSFLKAQIAARGLTGEFEKIETAAKEASQEAGSAVSGLGGVIEAIIGGVARLSDKAFNSFASLTGMVGIVTTELDGLVAGLKSVNDEMAWNAQHAAPSSIQALIDFNTTANIVKKTFFEQAIAATNLGAKIETSMAQGGRALRDVANTGAHVLRSFTLLDDSKLEGLKSQIQSAKDRVTELDDAIRGTIQSIRGIGDTLQQELLRTKGQFQEIEKLRALAARKELTDKLTSVTTDPNATGAQKAAAQAEFSRAMSLLDQVSKVRLDNAKAEEADAKAKQLADHTQKLADIEAEKQAKLEANIAIANAALLAKAQPAGAVPKTIADVGQDVDALSGGVGGVTANFNMDGSTLLSPEAIRRTVIPQLQQLTRSTR